MKAEPIIKANIFWLLPAEGGKKILPQKMIYAATTWFEEPKKEVFSIVLDFSEAKFVDERTLHNVGVNFFVPELVMPKLYQGIEIPITEGPHIVAKCQIVSIS